MIKFKPTLVLMLVAVALLASCAVPTPTPTPTRTGSSPLAIHNSESVSEIREAMMELKAVGDSGGGGKYCADDLALAVQGPMSQEWVESVGIKGGDTCFSRSLLAEGLVGAVKPEDIAAVPVDRDLVKDLIERLDLASFRSSLRPQFSIRDGTFPLGRLKDLAPAKIVDNVIELNVGEDWYFSITVLASGRIGRHPRAVLINVVDDALQGSYLAVSDYIVPLVGSGPLPVANVIEEWRHTRIPPLPSLAKPEP